MENIDIVSRSALHSRNAQNALSINLAVNDRPFPPPSTAPPHPPLVFISPSTGCTKRSVPRNPSYLSHGIPSVSRVHGAEFPPRLRLRREGRPDAGAQNRPRERRKRLRRCARRRGDGGRASPSRSPGDAERRARGPLRRPWRQWGRGAVCTRFRCRSVGTGGREAGGCCRGLREAGAGSTYCRADPGFGDGVRRGGQGGGGQGGVRAL